MIQAKDRPRRKHKAGIDQDENRHRRNHTTLQIRKQKRKAGLAMRRNLTSDNGSSYNTAMDTSANASATSANTSTPAAPQCPLPSFLNRKDLTLTSELIQVLTTIPTRTDNNGQDPHTNTSSSSTDMNMEDQETLLVTQMNNSNLIPILLQTINSYHEMSESFMKNVEDGGDEISYDDSFQTDIQEQAIVCLGNIAGTSQEMKLFLLNTNYKHMSVITSLVSIMTQVQKHIQTMAKEDCFNDRSHMFFPEIKMCWNLLEKLTWTLSTLCRGKVDFDKVSIMIPSLLDLYQVNLEYLREHAGNHTHAKIVLQILTNVIWTLAYMTNDATEDQLMGLHCEAFRHLDDAIFESLEETLALKYTYVAKAIVEAVNRGEAFSMQHEDKSDLHMTLTNLQLGALRIFSNYTIGDSTHDYYEEKLTRYFCTDSLVQTLCSILVASLNGTSTSKDVAMEALYLCSNLADQGERFCVNCIMNNASFLKILLDIIENGQRDLKIEALWVIGNSMEWLYTREIHELVTKHDLLKYLCLNLEFYDTKTTLMVLDSIDSSLQAGESLEQSPNYQSRLEEVDGIDKIESLQTHVDDSIYQRALQIIENYFEVDKEEEYEDANVHDQWRDNFPATEEWRKEHEEGGVK
ncbi:hypothetical protein CTEN210_00735 [Chaetoceros tenuissimus]|uniref:IBB domain-containing protein n=1 Tax=Chaetoceros tenuissimus TaxID=426638 RepID=A0AAD3CEC6_9STRA|nr:hypothetical protein CTEN210_00735 [Chaetoceros tenuissimus]